MYIDSLFLSIYEAWNKKWKYAFHKATCIYYKCTNKEQPKKTSMKVGIAGFPPKKVAGRKFGHLEDNGDEKMWSAHT